ncbi:MULTISPECIES: branched-chain amino acid ABC transporter permease [unclassified Archaeoglobus]|uniref:branched-chain amino acid ABC transporter permease n=1 Tax=unclassified Archaeoglobus TaxID=2643606 RepID=UPI0025C68D17|nr:MULTISPECIES: branched-chain amino acid ABC transporter permease [unclassified Archaeoglobus]
MRDFRILYAVIAILLFIVPFVGEYPTYLTGLALLFGISALALNVLLGYTGLLSFGNALFFGTGAYTVGLLIKHYDITAIEILFPASIATSFVVAVMVGFICVRHTRIYFTMLTIALASLFYALAHKLRPITGGDDGIRIYDTYLFGKEIASVTEFYYLILVFFFASMLTLRIILKSPFGLTLQAIRDSEMRARFAGISITKYRLGSFIVSGVFTGMAGALYALFLGQISPDDVLGLTRSGELVAMTILGGFTSFTGPVVGAFVFTYLKAFVSSALIYWYMVAGIIIIGIVLFVPLGIMGEIERRLLWRR